MPSADFVFKSESEIQEEIDRAYDQMATGGSKFRGMTYEDGVRCALDWVLGNYEERPMDD